MYCMQCFLKSKHIKVDLSMIKIGEWLRKLWSLRSFFLILPPGALTPQGIKGAVKRDGSKHWCTLQWCASRGWVITHENWTSWNGNIFCDTVPLCGEFTGHWWIPRTKASEAELWYFLWSAPWINGWLNNRKAGDLRRLSVHYDVIVMRHSYFTIMFKMTDWQLCRPYCRAMIAK